MDVAIDGAVHAVTYDYCAGDAVLNGRNYDQSGDIRDFFYTYDGFNRIDEVERNGVSIESYTYDNANNPVQVWVGSGAPTNHTYGTPGRLTHASLALGHNLTYDSAERVNAQMKGATNSTFHYDGASRLVGATRTTGPNTIEKSLWYAPDNQPVQEVVSGGTTSERHRWNGMLREGSTSHLNLLPWLSLRNGQIAYVFTEPDQSASMVLDRNGAALAERYLSAYGVEMYGTGIDWPTHGLDGGDPDPVFGIQPFGMRHISLRGDGLWLQSEPLLYTGLEPGGLEDPRGFGAVYAASTPFMRRDTEGTADWLDAAASSAPLTYGVASHRYESTIGVMKQGAASWVVATLVEGAAAPHLASAWQEATKASPARANGGYAAAYAADFAALTWFSGGLAAAPRAAAAPRTAEGLGNLSRAGEFGLRSYKDLRRLISGTGLQAHHLLEKRFAGVLGQNAADMVSVAVTRAEHQAFTNAWRQAIPYGEGTANATSAQITSAARQIYAEYPAILNALGL